MKGAPGREQLSAILPVRTWKVASRSGWHLHHETQQTLPNQAAGSGSQATRGGLLLLVLVLLILIRTGLE